MLNNFQAEFCLGGSDLIIVTSTPRLVLNTAPLIGVKSYITLKLQKLVVHSDGRLTSEKAGRREDLRKFLTQDELLSIRNALWTLYKETVQDYLRERLLSTIGSFIE